MSEAIAQFVRDHRFGVIAGATALAFSSWLFKMPTIPEPHKPQSDPVNLENCKKRWKEHLAACPRTGDKYLVIGCGFLGSIIIECLLQRGENVTVFDFSPNCSWVTDSRVTFIRGDVTNYDQVLKACDGKDVVYMNAALIFFMDKLDHQYDASFKVNVIGTQNVIEACNKKGIKHLIQTSTVHTTVPYGVPKGTVVEVNEKDPYVNKETATSHYGATKALAEEIVLKANKSRNADGSLLHTVAIRPLGIFGHNDHLVMELMLKDKRYDFCGFSMLLDWEWVNNVAYCHILAEHKMRAHLAGNKAAAPHKIDGEAFCVTDNKPMLNNEFRTMIMHYNPEVAPSAAPPRLLWGIAYVIEGMQRLLKDKFARLPGPLSFLTPTALKIMDMDICVKSNKVRTVLGYRPVFSVEESIQLATLQHRDEANSLFK